MILALMVLGLAPILLGMPYTSLMPVFAIDVLHGDSSTQGLLLTMGGIGAVIGALTIASLGQRQGSGKLLIAGAAGFGLSLVFFARSPVLWMAMVFTFLAGLTNSGYTSQNQTIIQTLTPSEIRGRVLGVYLLNRGLMPIGSLIAGALASFLGGPWAVTIMGASCFLLVIGVALFKPDMWKSKLLPSSEKVTS
jgi:MFS family permease